MNVYKIQHYSQRLRSNKAFELFVIAIIVISALLIGAKTYSLPDYMISALKVMDWAITFIFLFEIVVRFIAEEDKKPLVKKRF